MSEILPSGGIKWELTSKRINLYMGSTSIRLCEHGANDSLFIF